ncbi:MAG TPA: helix-turn-helix domain-containing protein [Solirubrobacterales bacterium]|jgi:DNA-binding transcriptional ArsR family regulator|nr:helix-turn-helix domain-containing protein [Solirubrobacterales bacterium]
MDDAAAAQVTKALGHPLRVKYLRALAQRRELSPSEFSRESGEALGNVSYHVKALFDAGVLEVSSMVPRRGAMEHRYSLTGPRAKVSIKVMRLLAKS